MNLAIYFHFKICIPKVFALYCMSHKENKMEQNGVENKIIQAKPFFKINKLVIKQIKESIYFTLCI